MSAVAVLGARGFVGRHVAAALEARGAKVRRLARPAFDLHRAAPGDLEGAEVVVNAIGALNGALDAVHVEGVRALIAACRGARVRRLVHVSALGASPEGPTRYQSSKGRAEAVLDEIVDFEVCIVRPSLIVGAGGASTSLFAALASLPFVPRLPSGPLRPVALGDLVELIARAADRERPFPRRLDAVGPEILNANDVVDALGVWLAARPRGTFALGPGPLRPLARIGSALGVGPMNAEALAMLAAGNVADVGPTAAALGRAPLRIADALRHGPASAADRLCARLLFVRPLLRLALAALWIATGCLSLGLYPLQRSRALMAEIGLAGAPASAALFGGGALDLGLGVLLLLGRRVKAVAGTMLAVMAAYTALATRLPAEVWLHPFAPLLKNLPVAAALVALIAMED